MALFLNLFLGHLVGDFLLQPGRLVIAKRDGAPGLLLHTFIVAGCMLAVIAGTIVMDWPAAVLVAVLHLVIERLTIVTYLKTPTRGLYTLMLDQTMHALSIALVVWLVGMWQPSASAISFGVTMPIGILAGIVGVLTVSLFGSIFVFETANAFLEGEASKGRVLRLDAARIGGFVERGAALTAALTLHPVALLVPFVPRVAYAGTRAGEDRKRLLIEASAGVVLCTVVLTAVALIALTAGGTQPARLGDVSLATAPLADLIPR